MFELTEEERRVVLFLACLALAGLGLKFLGKAGPAAQKLVKVNAESALVKLDINRVSHQDLLGLRNISPGLAEKIIAYRDTHGPYEDLEELKEIKGIKERRYEKLKTIFYISR